MRIVGRIPHQSLTITVFHMNDKYIVKFEAGPMEQVFKFNAEDVSGLEAVQQLLNEEFKNRVVERFNEMYISMKALK
jgi:hypothetical protein